MMPAINQVAISGRLTTAPASCRAEDGACGLAFALAASHSFRDSAGDLQRHTVVVPVTVWGQLARTLAPRLQAGTAVFLTGRLRSTACRSGRRTHEPDASATLEVCARVIQFLDQDKQPKEVC